ncbi:MAG: hypothetical protein CM1200mP18_15380 [Gammaproteobacteria bacterium]|nr:MAG: hypothetical protein CM1200mP18_15380 [Gammaproteobacteria bacterium]
MVANPDKEKMPFGFFSDPEVDALIAEKKRDGRHRKTPRIIHKVDRLKSGQSRIGISLSSKKYFGSSQIG